MPREYRNIVSLGSSCRTAYHIRRVYKGARGYPFDWWISPLRSTLRFLNEPDPGRLYHPDHLEPLIENGKIACVRNSYYGTYLFHAFPRREGGVVPNYLDYLEEPRQKTARLVGRLLEIEASSPTLFILHAGYHDSVDSAVWTADMEGMCDTLERRYGIINFEILLINTPITNPYGRILIERFDDVGVDWTGNGAVWAERLASVAQLFTPAPACRPGSRHRGRMSAKGRRRDRRQDARPDLFRSF